MKVRFAIISTDGETSTGLPGLANSRQPNSGLQRQHQTKPDCHGPVIQGGAVSVSDCADGSSVDSAISLFRVTDAAMSPVTFTAVLHISRIRSTPIISAMPAEGMPTLSRIVARITIP